MKTNADSPIGSPISGCYDAIFPDNKQPTPCGPLPARAPIPTSFAGEAGTETITKPGWRDNYGAR